MRKRWLAVVLLVGIGAPAIGRAQVVPAPGEPAPIDDPAFPLPVTPRPPPASPPRILVERVPDPWLPFKGGLIRVKLSEKYELVGQLVAVEPETVTLVLARSGEVVSVRKEGVVSFNDASADPRRGTSLERQVELIAADLESRARRRVTSGLVITVWGGVSLGACLIGIVALAASRGFDSAFTGGLITASVAGPIGTIQLAIGLPIYYAGKSELEIVRSLRRLPGAVVPIAPYSLGPARQFNPGGGLAWALSF